MTSPLHALVQFAADTKLPQIDVKALPQGVNGNEQFITNGLNIVFTITGAIAVMMIVIAGIKYTGSQGDPQGVSKAKNTIIYAVIGLIVVILSAAVVNFIVARVTQ